MDRRGLAVHLGGAAPHGNEAVAAVGLAELLDVDGELLGELPLVGALLDVVAVEVLDVRLLEHRLHGLDGPQFLAEVLEHVLVEHAGAGGGDVGVVLEHVPAAEHEVVELGERHVVVDERHVVRRCGRRCGSCPSG